MLNCSCGMIDCWICLLASTGWKGRSRTNENESSCLQAIWRCCNHEHRFGIITEGEKSKDNFIYEILTLPFFQIAAEVAAPLAKTEEIVLIGGNDSTTADIARLVGQIPPAVSALTGVDLSKVLGKIPGAKVAA